MFSSIEFAFDVEDFVIKSRLFKATDQDTNEESDVIVSLFSVPVLIPYHPNYVQLERINIYRLKQDLQKIYKIENIDHLASGLMIWDGKKTRLDGIIMLKESSYPLMFYPNLIAEGSLNLRVQVSQPKNTSGPPRVSGENLLDTEIVMRQDSPYVLGFPSEGSSYFLSISIAKKEAGEFQTDEYFQAGPEQNIPHTPSPTHKTIPIYPPNLKKERIGGKVILQVGIDKQGNVIKVDILDADHPDLGRASLSAIEQWKFTPIIKNNRPISANFPVVVEFRTDGTDSQDDEKK